MITGSTIHPYYRMAYSFEKVREQASAESARGGTGHTKVLRELDAKQRKALTLFEHAHGVTAKDIAELFGYQPRSSTWLCQRWVEAGFLVVADASRKGRKYRLAEKFASAGRDTV